MDDAWDIAEDRQKDIYPKLRADSDLQNTPNGGRRIAATMRQKSTENSFHQTKLRYVANTLQA